MGGRGTGLFLAIIMIFAAISTPFHGAFADHFISEHTHDEFPHEHLGVSVGHTHLDEGIDYETTCLQDQEFETQFLEDGITPNPNYLREDVGAYVFLVMGWGGWPFPGVPENFPVLPDKHTRHDLIQWLYDNNAQVIRGDWSWLPVDGWERYGIAINQNTGKVLEQNPGSFRCHQPGPNNQPNSLTDSILSELSIPLDPQTPKSAMQGPIHDPQEWNLIVNQWKNLMAKPRTQELISEKPVIVFGHSFGGNAVARIAQNTETKIDLLAIADPVGHRALRHNIIFEGNCGTEDLNCIAPSVVSTDKCDFALKSLSSDPQRELNEKILRFMHGYQVGFAPPFDYDLPWSYGILDETECITVDNPGQFLSDLASNPLNALKHLAVVDPTKVGFRLNPQTEQIYQRQLNSVTGATAHSAVILKYEGEKETTHLTDFTKSFVSQMQKLNDRPHLTVTSSDIQSNKKEKIATIQLNAEDVNNDKLTFHVLESDSEVQLTTTQTSATLEIPLTKEYHKVVVGVQDDGWPCFDCKSNSAPVMKNGEKFDGAWDVLTIHIANQNNITIIDSESCPEDSAFNGNSCFSDGQISCPSGTQFNMVTETCTVQEIKNCPAGTKVALDGRCAAPIYCPAGTIFTPNLYLLGPSCTTVVLCPEGGDFGYDPFTEKCINLNVCPDGSGWNAGLQHCTAAACPDGFFYNAILDKCDNGIYGFTDWSCPSGTGLNTALGLCTATHLTCPDGTYFDGVFGKCVGSSPQCPEGLNKAFIPTVLTCTTNYQCPALSKLGSFGPVGSSLAYRCEADSDDDGKLDQYDNCPFVKNEDQKDENKNGIGDACENNVFSPCPEGTNFQNGLCQAEAVLTCNLGDVYSPLDPICQQVIPTLHAPDNIVAISTSCSDSSVELGQPTVIEGTDPNPTISNNAPQKFPLGVTVVKWNVKDSKGVMVSDSQLVTVVTGDEVFEDLIDQIESLGLKQGIEDSLFSKIKNAQQSFENGNFEASSNQLKSVLNEIKALQGKKFDPQALLEITSCVDNLVNQVEMGSNFSLQNQEQGIESFGNSTEIIPKSST